MIIKVKQRWKYRDESPGFNFIAEITQVNSDNTFSVKVVSYGPKATCFKDQTYTTQSENNWVYLPGQDAP
jgi:hypothetical protein